MRELTTVEIDYVSGAGLISRAAAGVYGAAMGCFISMWDVGVSGGSVGGILGVGAISALAGVVLGGVAGAIGGAMYGLVADWDRTTEVFMRTAEQIFDRMTPIPKV